MAKTIILPAAISYQKQIADNLVQLKNAGISSGSGAQQAIADKVGGLIDSLLAGCDKLDAALKSEQAADIIVAMNELRTVADQLELEVDDSIWPLPKYSEMLFAY